MDLLTSFSPQILEKNLNDQREEIVLHDAHSLDDSSWPKTYDGQYAKSFLSSLMEKGVSQYIKNVQTDLRVLTLDELVLPITVNDGQYDNSYVCSPYSYFISYAKESLDFLSQAWLRSLIQTLLSNLGRVLRQCRTNKVVVVNNWFYSTNLYPSLNARQLIKVIEFLKQSFPDHAIVFRSIDPYTNPVCYQTLQQLQFQYIATRQIFFIDPHVSSLFESRLFKSDQKLLKNSDYEVIEGQQLTEADIPRLLELYRGLYIQKYSNLNPEFNEAFVRLVLEKKLLHFKALKKEGRIDGVVGYLERDGKMFCPFFGYDPTIPKEKGLYRLLSTLLMLEAYDRRLLFHQSSGASMFKKIRKANSCIEYTAVFYKHLKIQRHLPWIMLKNLYNSIGTVYMQRY